MADSSHRSVRKQGQTHLRAFERLPAPNSIANVPRAFRDSIRRLEDIIALQEGRVEKMRHRSSGTPSQTLRLRASLKDVLLISKRTLERIRQSGDSLEVSWTMLK